MWGFDGGDWVELASDDVSGMAGRRRLTVVTWNVWFGQWAQTARWQALMAEVATCRPDVIALQEVTRPMLSLLTGLDWLQADYVISDVDGQTLDADYGVWLAVRGPVRSMTLRTLPSRMGRGLLTADLGDLTVSTVHLESLRQSAPVRRLQLEHIDDWLDATRPRLLVGDMNFDDGAAEGEALGSDWRDAVGAGEVGEATYTIDGAVNHMHDVVHGGGSGRAAKRVRYDRVFVRGDDWGVTEVRRLGTRPLPDDMLTFPSDHFGLCAELVRPPAPRAGARG